MRHSPTMRASLALCFALSPCAVSAQSAPDDDAVVVTASRTEQRIRDAIPHITVLTRREIRDSGAVDLPSLLRGQAGFEFSQNGGAGAITGIFMRGGRSAQTLFLVDGVRIEDASAGQTAIQHLMLDEIERVEIVRGNVSSLYGSGAIGGVVQVFTRRGRGEPGPSAEVTLGQRGTSRFGARYGGQAGDTRFSVGVSRFETRGFSAIDPRLAPAANPDPDGYRNESISGNVSHKLNARHEVGATFLRSDGNVDYDSAFSVASNRQKSAQKLESLSGWWEARFLDAWRSRLTLAQGRDYRTDTQNDVFNSSSNTRNRQLVWDNHVALPGDQEVSAGVEILAQALVNSGLARPQYKRDVQSLRAGYRGRFDAHSLQANVRHEHYSDFGNADTYYLGYGFDLSDAWRLTASASTAFRAPSFVDLFGFGGNTALKPERARTYEGGVQWAAGSHRVRIVAFDTRYRDAITFSAGLTRNARKARVNGVESSYSGVLLGFDLRAALTLQDAVEQEPNALELPGVRRAKAYGSFSAYRDIERWRLGGELVSSGPRPDTHIVSGARLDLGGYAVVNLSARYRIDRDWHVTAKLENAFNEKYELVHGYNTAPRGLFVTVGWQPNL